MLECHEIDQTTGKAAIAFVGETPWHGLGSELTPGATIDEWKVAAGLNWTANKAACVFNPGDGERQYKDRYVLHRSDTGAPLCVVSNRYEPVQPGQVLEFFRDVTEQLGIFTMETAGALRGGRKIWALAKAADPILLGDDIVERYILLATSFDMTLPTQVRQTSVRVVCRNTLSAAMGAGGQKGGVKLNFSHRTIFNAAEIKQHLGMDEQWTLFRTYVTRLAETKAKDPAAYFAKVLNIDSLEAINAKKRERFDQLMEAYTSAPGQETASAKGTVWGLVNAVTYFTDHEAKARTQDNRLDSAWFGVNEVLKNNAFALARELVPVAA